MPTSHPHGIERAALDRASKLAVEIDLWKYFDTYAREQAFSDMEELCGLTQKRDHTIVDHWPMRLKLKPDDEGAKEEFEDLLASGFQGHEKWVEWQIAPDRYMDDLAAQLEELD